MLAGPEAHHLIHVMRATPGAEVTLFDGSGFEFSATVEKVGRSEVELAVTGREQIDRELPLELTLAVALPKGDRQKWLVEKAVELGVSRIVPLRTERSVALRMHKGPVEKVLARLQRTVVEASKQCGRNRLLEITEPQAWADLVKQSGDVACRLVAHPSHRSEAAEPVPIGAALLAIDPCIANDRGRSPVPWRNPLEPRIDYAKINKGLPSDGSPDAVLVAIGPEGGFSPEEIALATAAGWTCVDLGPRTLRIETAALMLAALVAASVQAT